MYAHLSIAFVTNGTTESLMFEASPGPEPATNAPSLAGILGLLARAHHAKRLR